jgi:hypothetical protein
MGPKKPSKESASKKESVSKRHKIAHAIFSGGALDQHDSSKFKSI